MTSGEEAVHDDGVYVCALLFGMSSNLANKCPSSPADGRVSMDGAQFKARAKMS